MMMSCGFSCDPALPLSPVHCFLSQWSTFLFFFSACVFQSTFNICLPASVALISRSFRSRKRKNKLSTLKKKKRCFPPAGEWVINQSRIYCDCGCFFLLEVWSCTRFSVPPPHPPRFCVVFSSWAAPWAAQVRRIGNTFNALPLVLPCGIDSVDN